MTTCRIENPDIPQAGRHGATHGRTTGPGRDGQHRTPTGRFTQENTALLTLQTMEIQLSGRVSRRTNLSSPKPGHTTGGSGRGARRGGGAASGRTGCQQNSSPR